MYDQKTGNSECLKFEIISIKKSILGGTKFARQLVNCRKTLGSLYSVIINNYIICYQKKFYTFSIFAANASIGMRDTHFEQIFRNLKIRKFRKNVANN